MTDVKKCPESMVYIPAGEFRMGSKRGERDERPVRDIYLSGFCMDRHEVTNAGYSSYQDSPSPRGYDGPDQPVVNVTWYQADNFCKSQGKRLPTEAEWEKAARGPEGFEYGTRSGGLNHDEAHYKRIGTIILLSGSGSGFVRNTSDVCSYPENGYGLCDMTGNVMEWVWDWYDEDAYSSMESRDPDGPSEGTYKVVRGGSWESPWALRAADREFDDRFIGSPDVGFRCVADPVETEEDD